MGMGGGGGGSSGKVDYPTYLKKIHADWLADDAAADGTSITALSADMATVMDAAIGASPFAGQTAYNPTTLCTNMTAAATEFDDLVDLISSVTDWQNYYNTVFANASFTVTSSFTVTPISATPVSVTPITMDLEPSDPEELIQAQVTAFNNSVDAEIESSALPRFQRGMQDVNAVVSSSFVLGESLIEAEGERRKAQFESDLRMQAWKDKWLMDTQKLQLEFEVEKLNQGLSLEADRTNQQLDFEAAKITQQLTFEADRLTQQVEFESEKLISQAAYQGIDQIIRLVMAKLDYKKAASSAIIESQRLSIVAFKEQADQNLRIDESDAKWDLEVFQHGGNLIASIAGATAVNMQKSSPLQSAMGGALSGMAAGAMAGSIIPGVGTAIGAGLGGLMGLAGGLFG